MIYDRQVEYINSYFGYPIYKVLRGDVFNYFVGGYGQEFSTMDMALKHAKHLMENEVY